MQSKPSVLIVGAGEFGASAAVDILRSGKYGTVTIIDKAPQLPALDAASTDINKAVRWDYEIPEYAELARLAIQRWNEDDWKGIYYQSGVLITNTETELGKAAFRNTNAIDPRVTDLPTPEAIRHRLSPDGRIPIGKEVCAHGAYSNPIGGWVWSAEAVKKLYQHIYALGGRLVTGAEFESFLLTPDGRDARGVKCKDGREFTADKIIMTVGAWSAAHPALREMFPPGVCEATGHTVVAMQLNEEETDRYRKVPVVMSRNGTGFYCFPAHHTGLMKFALHQGGYVPEDGVPRTAGVSHAVDYTQQNQLGWIPKESATIIREQIAELYPELAKKPFIFSRMCYYSDTHDSDWIIDFSPKYPSVLIATGCAGHAMKFLTVMGELIRTRLEGTLDPYWIKTWRINRSPDADNFTREGLPRQPLRLETLVTQRELLSPA